MRGRNMMRCVGLGVVLAASAVLGPPAAAQDEGSERLGSLVFREYCRTCHGNTAKGDGPVAEHLTPKPADLTGIAKRNGGEFPADRVRTAILKGEDVDGHGNSEMPVWGSAFQETRGGDDAAEIEARIDNLVAFLASIQQ